MKAKVAILVYVLLVLDKSFCITNSLKDKINELKNKAKDKFDDLTKKKIKQWEFEYGDKLSYPNGDEDKLDAITFLWAEYEMCTKSLVKTLTRSECLPSIGMNIYKGGVVHLPCNICASPEDIDTIDWMYSKTIDNPSFTLYEDKDNTVEESDGDLIIYRTQDEDAGLYYCTLGDSRGNMIFLEVIDDTSNISLVKPLSSHGPYPQLNQRLTISGLTLITTWNEWSDCSRCDHVGRRRRYGARYLRMLNYTSGSQNNGDLTEATDYVHLDEHITKLFEAFPNGIPYQATYLPKYLRSNEATAKSSNEIMIGLCKVPCKNNVIFEVKSQDGRIIEKANNSAREYSLLQGTPPQPPPPTRDIIFVERLQKIILSCPGTTLRDIPVQWKIGTLDVIPWDIDKRSGGRVYVTPLDQLVIESVRYTDTNLYSCWEEDELAGSIKLEIWQGSEFHWSQHVVLMATLLTVAVLLRVAINVLRNKKRKIGLL
ncbi:Ig-like V-type domain-containing protein FAM187A [Eumeta japonica]|uniref:Ig-like V-type domain-containing protein FAM187A n=1 Tax=Eumeta variegata TaxID=151549 RepID=A0A4C1TKS7_EUMVA|nr:Ig-like V-type domain-containing protein FAM187A [Eumeta japonica]